VPRRTPTEMMVHGTLVRRGASIALMLVGATVVIAGTFQFIRDQQQPTIASRTAGEWELMLWSTHAAHRDSAMGAMRTLEPRSIRTVQAATRLVADDDERVRNGAFHALVDFTRHGPAERDQVRQALRTLMRTSSSRGRIGAARLMGAIDADARVDVEALLTGATDADAAVREASVVAVGRVLHGAPLRAPPEEALHDRAVRTLTTAARDHDAAVRDAAVEALFQIWPREQEMLRAVLYDATCDSSADVRARAQLRLREFHRVVRPSVPSGTSRASGSASLPIPTHAQRRRLSCPR